MRAATAALIAAATLVAGCRREAADAPPANGAAPAAATATAGPAAPVVETPEGGFRMGSATAKVALVEYGSFTCPHCAAFAAEAMPDIRRMVAAGTLSYELRPYPRDFLDLAAGVVARCAGATNFFPVAERIFAQQQEWIGNAQTLTPGDAAKIDTLPPEKRLRALARGVGLDAYAGRGSTLDACLNDPAQARRLVATHDTAKIDATPTFLVNGRTVEPADWRGLKPLVDAAARG